MIAPGNLVTHNSGAFVGKLVLLREPRSSWPNVKVTPDMMVGELQRGQLGLVVAVNNDWALVRAPDGLGWCKCAMLDVRCS